MGIKNEWIYEWMNRFKGRDRSRQASKDSKTWDKECNVTFYYYIILYIILSMYYIQIEVLNSIKKIKKTKLLFKYYYQTFNH